ncbi:Membrane protein involved in the export of O-antigen and teichoic acid [Stenotrophomonas maltophilia]|nr:Membrane protein involved in the export of O-antigen and teichoic acid [Stenotrophomonas maltophilia]
MAKRALDTLATIVTRFGAKSVNLLVFLIVARQLSLAEMAAYGFIFSTTLIYSTILDLGTRNSLAVFIGKEPALTHDYTRSGFYLWLVLSVVGVPAAYLTLRASDLGMDPAQLAAPFSILLAAMLYLRMMQGTPLGTGDIKLFNRSEVASRVALLIGTVLLLAIPGAFTLLGAVWALAISQVAAALYLFAKQLPAIRVPSGKSTALAWKLVSRGFLFMLSVLLMNAAKRVSFLVVSHTSASDDAGTFFALQRLTEIITEVGMAIAVVAFSYSVRSSSTKEAVDSSAAMLRTSMLLFTVVSVAMIATADVSVPLLLGSQFSADGWLFVLLVAATLSGAPWTILFPSLSVVLSPFRVFLLMLPGVMLNIVTARPLTEAYGLNGAAISMLISNVVLTLSFLLVYRVAFSVPIHRFLIINRDDLAGMRALMEKIRMRLRR